MELADLTNFLLIVIATGVIIKIYLLLSAGVCCSKNSLEGMTVIVTGANSGIGLETARDLAMRNAKVILACRDLNKGHHAMDDIVMTTGNPKVCVKHLNLASLTSIRNFAREILDNESRLNILINNAAIVPPPGKHITEDNLELQFTTNHFGPFLLTNLLLPLLKNSAPSRIIVVSSSLHIFASLDLDNLGCEKHVRHPLLIYCNSKLANILFTRELSKKLSGTGVTVNCLHPGVVQTTVVKHFDWTTKFIDSPIRYLFGKNIESGAQTTIYLAVSKEVEHVSGEYFSDCRPTWTSPLAKDHKLAAELWMRSEFLTGLKD